MKGSSRSQLNSAGASARSSTSANNASVLKPLLSAKSVNVLDFAPAIDTNVFVVTKTTADKYHLSNLSDLAKSP